MAETPVPQNPFRPGAGTKPLYLAGRTHEQSQFARVLQQADLTTNIIITGLRGVGKTVLLDQLRPLAAQYGWLWTGNDWNEAASVSEKDVATRLIVDLAAVLSPIVTYRTDELPFGFTDKSAATNHRPLKFDDLWGIYNATPGFDSDKLKAVLEHIAKIITNAKIKGIVFAYDEAQNLADKKERGQFPLSLVVDVFSNLQKRDLGCQFLLVMTGLPTLITNLNEARTYTERMFHMLVLDRLSESETHEAVLRPIQISKSTLTFAPPTIAKIIKESQGYPFLIQYICREVFDAWIGRMTVGEAPSVPMTEITAKLDLDFFAPRWNRATDRQQIFMQVIATLENADGEFTIQDITTASRELLKKPFNPSHATQMLGHLAEKGLIYRNRRGAYCFAVPLLAGFIRRQSWDAATRRE
uniref:Orc1-like AAA ATPase domain-containing protein n=1 Tax=Rhodopseudomonas palustris (strain BisA53) TaxID=316055 RepID=Q07IC8_RHOP5